MSAQSRVKSVASRLLGLTVATVGLDVVSGQPRFTFGSTELLGGIHFIPALIGMFAVSEVLRHMTATSPTARVAPRQIGNVFRGVAAVGRRHWRSLIRGNAVGVVIGVLYMQGLNPGPTVFLERPELVYAVFLTFFLANLVMIPLGLLAIKSATRLLRVPRDR